MKLEEIKARIMREADAKVKAAEHDYNAACEDCKQGIYDKWYRYNRKDGGRVYDLGWEEQNKTTENDKVTFLP